jgi:hypothetical protein
MSGLWAAWGPDWSPAWVAVVVAWMAVVLLVLVAISLPRLSYRHKLRAAYVVVGVALLLLFSRTMHAPLFNWDLITTELLVADLVTFYAVKAYLLKRTTSLGRAMALNNYVLAASFLATQIWLLWAGGRFEFATMLLVRAVLAYTTNAATIALLEPPPPYDIQMDHDRNVAK